ncbi:MAG: T9SS type A sorting domain-containing protein, partial [Ferruginibacter sp.]|nr:T9SS type A sorting domain-containing protein [Ferruginibacter sp.]
TSGGVTGAIVTGLPAGVTGTYSGGTNGTLTISGTPTATGTFNYTVTTSGGCGTQSRTGSITVVMPPSITLTSAAGTNAQTICIGNAIATITYTTSGGITGATTTGLPAGVTGSYSGGTNGTYTISGTATTTGTINYTITTSGGVTTATGSITINALPATPAATTLVAYCQGSTAIPLTATGSTVLWYIAATGGVGSTIAPTPLTTTIGSITYYVSQTINGCEGPRLAIIVTVNVIPSAPLATTPLTYCQGATAVALTATGTNLKWYTAASGGTGISVAPIPSTANAGAIIYYVSQTMGICEGPRTAITVNVTALPTAPTVVSPVVYCQGATATVLVATGTGLLWYTTATGGAVGVSTAPIPSTLVAGTMTYYVAQTNSCGEGARAAIVVTTTSTPVAVTNLNATNITKTSALLNWIGAAGSFYTIEYKISTASAWTVVASGITANSIAVNNLIRGTTYNWRVYSNCSTSGGGNISSVATFTTISRNNAITNLKNGFGLKLTPNPIQSSGILDYLVPANGTIGITVIDANGKIIRSLFNANQNAGQYELNITNQLNTLAKGTYIIKLSQNGNGISLKFIKD